MMIGKGERNDALYVLNPSVHVLDSQFFVAFVNNVLARVWHERLGHLSYKHLAILSSRLNCNTKLVDHTPYYICLLAKQHTLSFPFHNHMSKLCFDLVHCDVWRPFHVNAITGYKYFLTLVDDHTRFTWVYLLRHKSNVLTAIPKFFKMVETQFNTKIKKFKLDKAPELQFIEFFGEQGVLD